jgi:hypothetical protein
MPESVVDDRRNTERTFDVVMSFFGVRGKLLSLILASIVVCSAFLLTFYAGEGFRKIYGEDVFLRPFLVAILLVLLASIQAGHLNSLKKGVKSAVGCLLLTA